MQDDIVAHEGSLCLDCCKGREYNVDSVQKDYYETKLRGSHLGVGELELPLQVCTYVDVHREDEIGAQRQKGRLQVDKRRETYSYEHQGLVHAVYVVVQEEAVLWPLLVAHTGDGAVQGVSKPVEDKSQ